MSTHYFVASYIWLDASWLQENTVTVRCHSTRGRAPLLLPL